MQRLKTRPQFQAALAGGTVARTAHFALHRVAINAGGPLSAAAASIAPTKAQETSVPAGGAAQTALVASSAVADSVALPTARSAPLPLFSVADVWLGAMVPKRWARRAVTRNAIRRQIHAVGESLQPPLAADAHLVRLRGQLMQAERTKAHRARHRVQARTRTRTGRCTLVTAFRRLDGEISVQVSAVMPLQPGQVHPDRPEEFHTLLLDSLPMTRDYSILDLLLPASWLERLRQLTDFTRG